MIEKRSYPIADGVQFVGKVYRDNRVITEIPFFCMGKSEGVITITIANGRIDIELNGPVINNEVLAKHQALLPTPANTSHAPQEK